jgi:hypothetical protein
MLAAAGDKNSIPFSISLAVARQRLIGLARQKGLEPVSVSTRS